MNMRIRRPVPPPGGLPAGDGERGSAPAPGAERSAPRGRASQALALTKAQAAESLGISQRKLEQYIGSGELASLKFGRSRRILRSDLEVFARRLRDETLRAEHPFLFGLPCDTMKDHESDGGSR